MTLLISQLITVVPGTDLAVGRGVQAPLPPLISGSPSKIFFHVCFKEEGPEVEDEHLAP